MGGPSPQEGSAGPSAYGRGSRSAWHQPDLPSALYRPNRTAAATRPTGVGGRGTRRQLGAYDRNASTKMRGRALNADDVDQWLRSYIEAWRGNGAGAVDVPAAVATARRATAPRPETPRTRRLTTAS